MCPLTREAHTPILKKGKEKKYYPPSSLIFLYSLFLLLCSIPFCYIIVALYVYGGEIMPSKENKKKSKEQYENWYKYEEDKLSPEQEKQEVKRLKLDRTKLNERQKLFCMYYVKNFNATAAAVKAGYSPASARFIGYENLTKPYIKAEIERLKKIKIKSLMAGEEDIVELHMRIAFADITDFVEFGRERKTVMGAFGPVIVEDPVTGEKRELTRMVNVVKFKDSKYIDGNIVNQVKMGKDGASIKLEDKQRSLKFLEEYFNMNPMSKHKQKYDNSMLEIARLKAGGDIEEEVEDDGFLDALKKTVKEAWDDEENE